MKGEITLVYTVGFEGTMTDAIDMAKRTLPTHIDNYRTGCEGGTSIKYLSGQMQEAKEIQGKK